MLPPLFLDGLGHKPTTPASPALSIQDLDFTSLSKRYEQFVLFDQEKTKFLSDLITRYEYLHQQYQTILSERDRERDWLISWQTEKQQYEKWIKNMQRALADNPFVVVLIDGDGMIFADELLHQGEQGGRVAAAQISAAVQDYIENELDNVPLGARVVCRIYANVQGLGDVLVRAGIIGEIGQFQDFVRGFTRGKTLFDFVDVGTGKDRADEKVIESFKLFSQDYHCRRLLLGCSHDNGYARTLEEYSDKSELVDKVVLLEGVPFEKELVSLPYNTKKFPGLFRCSKIVVRNGAGDFIPSQTFPLPGSTSSNTEGWSMPLGVSTRFSTCSRAPGSPLMDSPVPLMASLMSLPRTPSSSTIASDGFQAYKLVSPTNSWAAKAAAPASPAPVLPSMTPANRDEEICRNRIGQRVDAACKVYDKTEVDRIKKMKLCNVHFLRNECPYATNCTHLHTYKPTKEELSTLRLVARMAPCQHGSGCQDVKCIYGHRCPAPPHKIYHVKGTKSCIFGQLCKFPPELHDIDTNIVKTVVVR